jgi:hypothetical protein
MIFLVFFFKESYHPTYISTHAGLELTTHSSSLLDRRRRRYLGNFRLPRMYVCM